MKHAIRLARLYAPIILALLLPPPAAMAQSPRGIHFLNGSHSTFWVFLEGQVGVNHALLFREEEPRGKDMGLGFFLEPFTLSPRSKRVLDPGALGSGEGTLSMSLFSSLGDRLFHLSLPLRDSGEKALHESVHQEEKGKRLSVRVKADRCHVHVQILPLGDSPRAGSGPKAPAPCSPPLGSARRLASAPSSRNPGPSCQGVVLTNRGEEPVRMTLLEFPDARAHGTWVAGGRLFIPHPHRPSPQAPRILLGFQEMPQGSARVVEPPLGGFQSDRTYVRLVHDPHGKLLEEAIVPMGQEQEQEQEQPLSGSAAPVEHKETKQPFE